MIKCELEDFVRLDHVGTDRPDRVGEDQLNADRSSEVVDLVELLRFKLREPICDAGFDTSVIISTRPSSSIQLRTPTCD